MLESLKFAHHHPLGRFSAPLACCLICLVGDTCRRSGSGSCSPATVQRSPRLRKPGRRGWLERRRDVGKQTFRFEQQGAAWLRECAVGIQREELCCCQHNEGGCLVLYLTDLASLQAESPGVSVWADAPGPLRGTGGLMQSRIS
jgi:hypothetical protein